MKKTLLVLLVLLLAFSLVACSTPAPEAEKAPAKEEAAPAEEAEAPAEEEFVIGYLCSNFNDTGQVYVKDGAKAKAEELGMVFKEADAQEDVIKQQDQVNAFIVDQVDVLVVVPVSTDAMDPIIKVAADAGIPLVFVNRNPFGAAEPNEGTYFVGSEEIVAGNKQGEYLVELLGDDKDAKIFILQGKLDNEAAIKRTEGAKNTLEAAGFSIEAIEVGEWQRDQGLSITENWMTAYGDDITAILGNNDEMALGAVEAMGDNENGVIILGVDFTPDAKAAVVEGKMVGSVRQDLAGQGAGGVEIAYDVLTSGSSDAVKMIPFVLITQDEVGNY